MIKDLQDKEKKEILDYVFKKYDLTTDFDQEYRENLKDLFFSILLDFINEHDVGNESKTTPFKLLSWVNKHIDKIFENK